MIKPIRIGHHLIGTDHPPFIIAELSGNHNQSLARALEIVDAAADAGASAIKLQTYTADSITLDCDNEDFHISGSSLWSGKTLYELYRIASTPWEWHYPIMARAAKLGLVCFSSPFCDSAVDFLESLNVPAYKIASFENNHIPLLRRVASTGKPLLISTGLASLSDLELAVDTVQSSGCESLILLKCTSSYPSNPSHSNISTIPHMRATFGCEVGLSDHTLGIGVALASIGVGCTVIEKHLTLSRSDGGVDSAFSIEPSELATLVQESQRAWSSFGQVSYGPTPDDCASLPFRRSIYASADILAGEEINLNNTRIIRPGHGAPPKYLQSLLGAIAPRSYKAGSPIRIEDFFNKI